MVDRTRGEGFESLLTRMAVASTVVNRNRDGQLHEKMHKLLHWLNRHGGSGALLKTGGILAGGDIMRSAAPVLIGLEEYKMVVIDQGRVSLTDLGKEYTAIFPHDDRMMETVHSGRVMPIIDPAPEDY